MKTVLVWSGNIAGLSGLVVTAVAALARASGQYHLGGFESMTLFQAGVGLMVAGILLKVQEMSMR